MAVVNGLRDFYKCLKWRQMITIDGKQYKVTENLGFQRGYYAKVVETPDGERVAVKDRGFWRWYYTKEKLNPVSSYIGQKGDR